MRARRVIANWKMHGGLAANATLLAAIVDSAAAFRNTQVVVCVPYPYLFQTQSALSGSGIEWGAQNVSQHASGAYTGEVSVGMLRDFRCRYVLVGHSERRALYGEDSATVAGKFKIARAGGLTPVLCVGESLAERKNGQTESVIASQLDSVIAECGIGALADGVIAYEPVWAIGTGRTAAPPQAQAVHAFIRSKISDQNRAVADELSIIYGGSVKAGNARELFAMPDIDGGLIGGASLAAAEFLAICSAA